jgi:hypothetical protein
LPRVLAVVFQNGTSVGDRSAIEEIFARRQGAADEFARWNAKPQDWSRDRFAEEFGRVRTSQGSSVARSAYEVGASIAVSQIRAELERSGTPTIAALRQFLRDKARDWQQATGRQ